MVKHLFLVRWVREGRVASPVVDMHASCVWPLGPEDNDTVSAKALGAMIGGYENLPPDVRSFCSAYWGMSLRMRYNPSDMSGPYVLNDADEVMGRDDVQRWVEGLSDGELSRYHANSLRRRSRHADR